MQRTDSFDLIQEMEADEANVTAALETSLMVSSNAEAAPISSSSHPSLSSQGLASAVELAAAKVRAGKATQATAITEVIASAGWRIHVGLRARGGLGGRWRRRARTTSARKRTLCAGRLYRPGVALGSAWPWRRRT